MQEKPLPQQVDEHHDRVMTAKQVAVVRNRTTVGHLFSLVRLLARLNLPFRGHDEGLESCNRGVFREMVTYLSNNGNEVLKNHLLTAPKNATYLSAQSQNTMISIVGEAVREGVLARLREAQKFVVLMDETQDLSHRDQVSIFVRFVIFRNGKAKEEERLLAMVTADGKTGFRTRGIVIGCFRKIQARIGTRGGSVLRWSKQYVRSLSWCSSTYPSEKPRRAFHILLCAQLKSNGGKFVQP